MTTLTEPAGWGEPGTVRHAEQIGHTVWASEHPEINPEADTWFADHYDTTDNIGPAKELRERNERARVERQFAAADLDALRTDDLVDRSVHVRADLDTALANVRKVFGTQTMCPISTCVRTDHDLWEMCEDEFGHTWFQGEPDHYDTAGGIQL